MIIIEFSQCVAIEGVNACVEAMPVIPRCRCREAWLRAAAKDIGIEYRIATHDEHFLLIAQKLRRDGVIKKLKFVSVCGCSGAIVRHGINVDENGDLLDDPHHGFFGQRLEYLR